MSDMTPAEMREQAKRLREDGWSWGDVEQEERDVRAGADALDRLADVADARARDASHPEYVPEAVMDAAFASQSDWWRPGESPAVQAVLVPQLIENVATATYAATRRETTDHEVGRGD